MIRSFIASGSFRCEYNKTEMHSGNKTLYANLPITDNCQPPTFKHMTHYSADNMFGDKMNKKIKEKIKPPTYGIVTGIVNGLLGAGGGMIAVPALKKVGLDQRRAQANAIAVILPISIVSCVMYMMRGNVTVSDSLPYIPGGIIGTLIGTFLLSKLPTNILKKLFGGFMIWAGIRLLMP